MDTSLQGLIAESKRRIGGVEPGLIPIIEELIRRVRVKGINFIFTQGKRTMVEQAQLFGQGRNSYVYKGIQYGKPSMNKVTNAEPGQSIHNYGIALDFALIKNGKEIIWDTTADLNHDGKSDWIQIVEEAKKLKFSWGGDWASFRDFPHLEWLGGLSYNQVFNGVKPKFTVIGKDYSSKFYTEKVAKVKTKTAVSLYQDAEFKKPLKKDNFKKGTTITIIGLTHSKSGVPRFITSEGLITTNRQYVEEVKTAKKVKAQSNKTHTVKSGDTLSAIAKTNSTTVVKIKSLNKLNTDNIKVGQKLKVPAAKVVKTTKYTVKSGDNLTKIAKAKGTTVSKLKSLNGLKSDLIKVGQVLKVLA